MKPLIEIFPNGQVEVGNGKPGYNWVPAYSQRIDKHTHSNPLTLAHWRAIAKRDGAVLGILKKYSCQSCRWASNSKAERDAHADSTGHLITLEY